MRWTLSVAAALLGGLLALMPRELPTAEAGSRSFRPDTLPVEKLRPGMKGYGLTVFEGTQPERFDVEIIDILPNFRPRQDAILIKTKHPRLDVVNVVRGMSGSPIYIGGKMIGAYAYGWTFGKEPVAGVTPIANMIDDIERPLPDQIFGWPLKMHGKSKGKSPKQASNAGNPNTRYAGNVGRYRLDDHLQQLRQRLAPPAAAQGALQPVATPVLLGGLGNRATALATELFEPFGLEPVAGGGQAGSAEGGPAHYVDGGAVAVQLVRGDINATGLGTVTRVEGDRLVAFGHPMMNGGVTALPTAVGKVLWFLASEAASFKLGMAVRPLGALVNDRQASIVVSESASAPIIPVSLRIDGVPGAPVRDWNFDVAHEKFMTPSLIAMALGNAMQATGADRQDVSWRAMSKVKVKGYGELELEDFGVAIGGTPDPRQFVNSHLVSSIGGIVNNPWEPALIEEVETHIQVSYARDILQLRGARLLRAEVDAGEDAEIELTLLPFQGKPFRKVVRVPMPAHLAGETVSLSVLPGHSLPREKAAPETLADFMANLENPIYPPKSVVISYSSGSGVSYKGRVVDDLPPGAFDAIRQRNDGIAPEPFKSMRRHTIKLDSFMVGSDSVQVRVLPVLR